MGKKRSRRSSKRHGDKDSTRRLVNETDIKILAWLDYTLSKPETRGLFRDTIEEHLIEDGGVRTTFEQVKQRLERLSKRYSSESYDVHRQGSTCLFSIDEQTRVEIADYVQCLQACPVHPAIHGRGERNLRSKSPASNRPVGRYTKVRARALKTPSFQQRNQGRDEGSVSRTNGIPLPYEDQVWDSPHFVVVPHIDLKRQHLPLDPTDSPASR